MSSYWLPAFRDEDVAQLHPHWHFSSLNALNIVATFYLHFILFTYRLAYAAVTNNPKSLSGLKSQVCSLKLHSHCWLPGGSSPCHDHPPLGAQKAYPLSVMWISYGNSSFLLILGLGIQLLSQSEVYNPMRLVINKAIGGQWQWGPQ